MAIIGFGFMGVAHAKNILASDKLELCGIIDNRDCDIFSGITQTGNHGELDLPIEQLRQIPVYKTLAQCIAKENLDAVCICVPLFLHYEMAKQALELGLDVLLEKPFCPSVEQCKELIDLAHHKKKILMVAHCLRFSPAVKFLGDCIRDKRFGSLKTLSTTRIGGMPTWGVWKDPDVRKTCGGGLWDLLIHDIDFINHQIGIPDEMTVNLNVDDYWELSFEKDCATVSIKGGFLHPNAVFSAEYFATFEHASLQYNTSDPDHLYISTCDGLEKREEMKGDDYHAELDYFAHCIHQRAIPTKCLPQEAMRAIEICTLIPFTIQTCA
ncbi:MAG: Gfo/Idh/MocA family oxidoreductase [Phycisphaeraceae bacterium]|nr:Gfo/Idh/MocA family oxidoreductase [Phycisphaeraceae bacterium]